MRNDYFRYYKPKMLIGLIVLLSTLFGLLISMLSGVLNGFLDEPYVQFPTAGALVIATLAILDKKGLRMPILKHLYWVSDISGRYEGEITYENFETGKVEKKQCALEITQTASLIDVKTHFDFAYAPTKQKTKSISLVSSIVEDQSGEQDLVFTYQNKGNSKLAPSNGTNILTLISNEDKLILDGVYYTDRLPKQTKGDMRVEFKSKTLKKEY